ncbi:MAG: MerR family DNA-binding transcriptional regulator [Candidatus Niyogibacteria bacterium]|nr:MerR family DNA-binding transcriptional regulator [Candidatus Niyogibacteria bacterium]
MGRYMTIKEAAKFLGVSALTLRNWDKKGQLVAIRHPVNNYRLYTFSEIEKFLKSFEGRRPRKLKVQLIED